MQYLKREMPHITPNPFTQPLTIHPHQTTTVIHLPQLHTVIPPYPITLTTKTTMATPATITLTEVVAVILEVMAMKSRNITKRTITREFAIIQPSATATSHITYLLVKPDQILQLNMNMEVEIAPAQKHIILTVVF